MEIPKIIHQIWIGPNKRPDIWMNTWSKDYMLKNKNYSYILWTNDNIEEILKKYPISKKIFYVEKEQSGRSDILRYLILYEFCGIYIDADSV